MIEYENMPITDFDNFLQKRVKLTYCENIGDESSAKTMTGKIIDRSVTKSIISLDGGKTSHEVYPVICKFFNENDEKSHRIIVRSIKDISIIDVVL